MRVFLVGLLALVGAACANPTPTEEKPRDAGSIVATPDSGVTTRDGGVTTRDGGVTTFTARGRTIGVVPAGGHAASPRYEARGRLGITGPQRSANPSYEISGGLVPSQPEERQ